MSVYISQLPEYSGSAADLRWFIMNNSGQTTTFKYSGYTSPFKVAAGTNNSNNIYDTNVMGGSYSAIIGGSSNTINGGNYNGIFAGYNNTISSSYSFIGGGSSNTNTGEYAAIVGGFNNTNNNNAGFIGGGRYLTTDGGGSEANYAIGGAYGRAQGICSGVLGAWGSYVYDDGNNSDPYRRSNIIVGSPLSEIGISNNNGRNFGGIYSSLFSYIRGTSASPTIATTIFGSSGSTIQAGVQYSSVIGGYNNTITNGTNVVMVGTSGRTATRNNATFVENLVVFNYTNLNYADDTAAAIGGVVLGQVYHNAGALRIRIV